MDNKQLILQILHDAAPQKMYGLSIIKTSGNKLGRGLIHVDLFMLTDEGFVVAVDEEKTNPQIGIRRKLFGITSRGEFELLRMKKR